MNRTRKAARNIVWAWGGKLLILLSGFLSRTVFIFCLGKTYLGINGLYTEVLSMLSLAELGFGTALNFSMYRPVAENDEDKIRRLLKFYRRIYHLIAAAVLLLGLSLLPFLPYIVKGGEAVALRELRIYFLFYLTNTVVNYLVSYKFSYVNALQNNYIVTSIEAVTKAAVFLVQIVVLWLFRNFYAYLFAETGFLLFSRLLISMYLDRKYPILAERTGEELREEERRRIFREVRALSVHQFASVAVHSTDNLIISSLTVAGIVAVGLVSNYMMLISAVLAFVNVIFSSLTSGFGNVVALSDQKTYLKAFQEVQFLSFWFYGFCAIGFYVLIPPFIVLWLGEDYLIDNTSFFLIVLNQYLMGQSATYNNVRVANGNFHLDQYVGLLHAILNLVISIIAARYLDLAGVYIGTIVSRMVLIIARPILTYRMLFGTGPAQYFKTYCLYFCSVCLAGLAADFLTSLIFAGGVSIPAFIASAFIVLIAPNLFFYLLFRRSKEFDSMWVRVNGLLKFTIS